jgi:hypothetical protein
VLSVVTLNDNTGTPVTLHQDTPTGKRWLASALGLRGIQNLRNTTTDGRRVRPQAHGGIVPTMFEDARQITLVGEIMSTVSIEDAFNEFDAVAAPMIQTLDSGPSLLQWTEGRGGINLIPNPSFEYDTAGAAPAVWQNVNGFVNPFEATLTADTAGGAQSGTKAMKIVTFAAALAGANCPLAGTTFYAGTSYTFALWLKGNAGGEAMKVTLGDWGAGDSASITPILTTGWQRFSVTWTPTGNRSGVSAAVVGLNAAAITFWTDALIVSPGSAAPTYIDGDTATAIWDGAAGSAVSELGLSLQRLVKLDGDLDPPLQDGAAVLSYQAQFVSEDPRAYSQTLQTVVSSALSTSGGGRVYPMTYNWLYSSSGGGTVSVTNAGNRPTPPIFRIYGTCVNPQIVLVGSGLRLSFIGMVQAGDYLEVDVAKRTVKYFAGGTGVGVNRLNFYDATNSTWFELPKGISNLQMIAGSADLGAKMSVMFRSAYA